MFRYDGACLEHTGEAEAGGLLRVKGQLEPHSKYQHSTGEAEMLPGASRLARLAELVRPGLS